MIIPGFLSGYCKVLGSKTRYHHSHCWMGQRTVGMLCPKTCANFISAWKQRSLETDIIYCVFRISSIHYQSKVWVSKTFSLLCAPRLHLLIKNTVKNGAILLQFKTNVFYLNVFLNVMYSCEVKLYFQHHYSRLQCHMIFRNQYNMLICCSRNMYDYYQCCAASYFCENHNTFFRINNVQKNSIYLKSKSFVTL